MVISADRQQVLRLIETEGAQVADVLPGREYDESHIPGAVSIPLKQLTGETVSTSRVPARIPRTGYAGFRIPPTTMRCGA